MNRRLFLRNSALLTAPVMLSGLPVFGGTAASHPWLQSFAKTSNYCGKILVIVQLNGGNDGLNMVIPLDKYTELNNARSALMIPSSNVLGLTGTTTTGLHPSMTGMQSLYNNGKMVIVQGVSYPNPNYSHFQAQDIWFSSPASSSQALDTGWLGRNLDASYSGFPVGYPNTSNPDPLAIQIGGALPLSIQGASINMGYNVPNPASLVNVATATTTAAPASDYGTELTFLRMMQSQSNAYTGRISTAYNAQATQSTQYAGSGNSLSDQLKVVARLIGGGLGTQIYIVNHPDSFDTHVNQVGASTAVGSHANSLGKLSVAISAFMDDITLMGKANKVTGMTFSEFGRRVISNASTGTDHGTAAPVIFFGAALNGGIIGTSPNLPASPTASTQVPTQYDFRQLYATVLQSWMCMSATQSQSILNTTTSTNTPMSIFAASPLPVTAIELSAGWEGNQGRIDFLAQRNESYQEYRVERSEDGQTFRSVALVMASSQTGAAAYRHMDERINAARVFYRIAALDKSGELVYSAIVQLNNGARAQALSIYPNPVRNYTINIDFLSDVDQMVDVEIFDMEGRRVYYNGMSVPNRHLNFRVPDMMSSYTPYILRVKWGNNEVKEQISFV
jgi:uncharacterized protein (DUF1501 family)